MARVHSLKAAGILAGGVLFAALLLIAQGCARQQVVDNMPPPNFNGPNVVQPDRPAVAARPPVQQQLPPPAPKPEVKPAPEIAKVPAGIPRDWIPRPNAEKREWDFIVIHHSATPAGGLAMIDKEHKAKGWDGCGYHFVIGNGTDTRDGQVEPSYRWQIQKWGAHAKTPDNQYNEHGIGICLVGNFDIDRPTASQMQSLTKLVTYLMHKYNVPASHVIGHRETKPTDCPGRNVNVASIRRAVAQVAKTSNDTGEVSDVKTLALAAADASRDGDETTSATDAPGAELLVTKASTDR